MSTSSSFTGTQTSATSHSSRIAVAAQDAPHLQLARQHEGSDLHQLSEFDRLTLLQSLHRLAHIRASYECDEGIDDCQRIKALRKYITELNSNPNAGAPKASEIMQRLQRFADLAGSLDEFVAMS